MATKYSRGHKIYYDFKIKVWKYEDNEENLDIHRLCKKCGKRPTEEGYDACLGFLSGVVHACCGHGISKPTIVLKTEEQSMNIQFYNKEQLKEASPEQLTSILTGLTTQEQELNNSLVEVKTKITAKQEELEQVKGKIKEKFGVETVEDLEKIKDDIISKFLKTQEELKTLMEERDE